MKTLADRLKVGLEKLGYEFNQLGQFSVEITNMAVVVSEKIDLSQLTKNRDNVNILYFLHEPRIGGPMQISRLSVTVNRYPISNLYKKSLPVQVLMKKEYESGNIPTKSDLWDLISEKLSISNNNIIELLNKKEMQFLQHQLLYKPFIK